MPQTKGCIPWNKGKSFLPGEKNPMFGKKHSSESKRKMSEAHMVKPSWNEGKPMSEETKKKLSEAKKGHVSWSKGKTGIFSEETIRKMSESHKGLTPWNKGKKGSIPWNKGRTGVYSEASLNKMSENNGSRRQDVRIKISIAKKGRQIRLPVERRAEINRNISKSLLGRKVPDEQKKKMHKPHPNIQGEKHYKWSGGKQLTWARQSGRKRKRGFMMIIKNNPFTEPIDYHHIHPDLPYVIPCPVRIHQMFRGKSHYNLVNAFLGFRFEVESCATP
jgi:hypothetical protein